MFLLQRCDQGRITELDGKDRIDGMTKVIYDSLADVKMRWQTHFFRPMRVCYIAFQSNLEKIRKNKSYGYKIVT